MSEKTQTAWISTEDTHIMSRTAVIASFAAAAVLSPLAFLMPHAVVVIVGLVVIPSIIFLGIEEAKTTRRPVENRLRSVAGAAFIIAGILGALCSVAAA